MKFSKWGWLFLTLGLFAFGAGRGWAQNQWIDSILPPDHLLENLPWMGEDGKIESRGLFDFEDVRGIGQKDLILIYRQSVPVNELDKPHNQTLIVCFYDPKLQKYVKNFEDEGGPIQWVKFVPGPDKKSLQLFLQRDDLKGDQVLKGFAYLKGGMKEVLEAVAPQIYAKFMDGQILCSSKEMPKETADAEHLFSWDESKSQYAEAKPGTGIGWSGASIAVAPPVVVAKPSAPAPPAASQEGTKVAAAPPGHPSKNGWWDDPLVPDTAVEKLKTEMVPALIKKGEIAVLGLKAKALFDELEKKGISTKEISGYRSTYYAAVASTTLDNGDAKGAAYYLKLALRLQSDNADALALKEKMK